MESWMDGQKDGQTDERMDGTDENYIPFDILHMPGV